MEVYSKIEAIHLTMKDVLLLVSTKKINRHGITIKIVEEEEPIDDNSAEYKELVDYNKDILKEPNSIWVSHKSPVIFFQKLHIKLGKVQRIIISELHAHIGSHGSVPYLVQPDDDPALNKHNRVTICNTINSLVRKNIIIKDHIVWNGKRRVVILPVQRRYNEH